MRMLAKMLFVAAATCPGTAWADVKLHPLFCDHMVLQRDAKVNVWGTADPGETVSVKLDAKSAAGSSSAASSTTANDKGEWKTTLAVGAASTEVSFEVKGKNTVALKNVAIGDVWLCSGQSNMEWKLAQLTKDDQGKKVAAQAANPMIRYFSVPNRPFRTPQATFPVSAKEGLWLECTPENAIGFSAVGYFFGKDIAASQKVPVGLIAADWGGTPAQAWTSYKTLKDNPTLSHYADKLDAIDEAKVLADYEKAMAAYKVAAAKAKEENKPAPRAPNKPQNGGVNQNTATALYNGMIHPIQNYAIKGAIWYQGESNAAAAKEYRTLFTEMIRDWRKHWAQDFPFYAVQLAPYRGNQGSSGVDYAELRDAQTYATKALPKVGIAVITDSGDETDIHPQAKGPVGARLALAARALTYGEKIEYSGPAYKSHTAAGGKITVQFDHLGGGLKCKGDVLTGFAIAGADNVYHAAKATIEGDTVVLTCDGVAKPVHVRYGWINFAKPELNFFNAAGLPAMPFRTDDAPLTTK
jgi:sialate O-acetylesterase